MQIIHTHILGSKPNVGVANERSPLVFSNMICRKDTQNMENKQKVSQPRLPKCCRDWKKHLPNDAQPRNRIIKRENNCNPIAQTEKSYMKIFHFNHYSLGFFNMTNLTTQMSSWWLLEIVVYLIMKVVDILIWLWKNLNPPWRSPDDETYCLVCLDCLV